MARMKKRRSRDKIKSHTPPSKDQPLPSSPMRLPIVNVYCGRPDGGYKCIRGFAATWAAGRYIRHWIDVHGEYRLITDRRLRFDDDWYLQLDTLYFPDLIADTGHPEWELPPDLERDPYNQPKRDPALPVQRSKNPKRARIEGAVTLKDLLPTGMKGSVARAILRKQFPRTGKWEWKPDDPVIEKVKAALESGK